MKLILSVESLSRELTGVGRYTLELARRLPEALSEVDELRFHHQQRWLETPCRLLEQPVDAMFPGQKMPLWFRNLKRLATRHSWRNQCRDSVFHGPNYFIPPYASNGVVTVHDLSVQRHPEWHPSERVRQHERLLSASLKRSGRVIAVSESTRAELVALFSYPEDRIDVTPLAAGPEFRPRMAAETLPVLSQYGLSHGGYALCIATLEPRKNIENLIIAYAALPKSIRSRFPLILVGKFGWRTRRIRDLIVRYESDGWLHHMGYAPESVLPILYSGARVFAYPSWYEGFGLPVLEAMASGVPILTSIHPALLEVTQGHAMHVPPDNVDLISSALGQIIDNSEYYQDLASQALRVAALNSWDNCINLTIATYRKLS